MERDKLPSGEELKAAFRGAVDGVLQVGENYYAGHMKAAIVKRARKKG